MRNPLPVLLAIGLLGGCGTLAGHATATRPPTNKGSDVELLAVLFKEGRPKAHDSLFDSVTDVDYTKFALKHDVVVIKRLKQLRFYVVGQSDAYECGSDGCNALSKRRAQLVHEWLLANGVSPLAMGTPVGTGSSRPLTDNSTEAARSVNRRAGIEFLLPVRPDP